MVTDRLQWIIFKLKSMKESDDPLQNVFSALQINYTGLKSDYLEEAHLKSQENNN